MKPAIVHLNRPAHKAEPLEQETTMNSQGSSNNPRGTTTSVADAPVLNAEAFKTAFRNHPAGVAIVTADAGDGPVAMTVTSVFSVSAEPPLLVFSASATSSSTPTIRAATTVVVHIPGADQVELARLAATSGADRFPEGLWTRLPTGEPVYPGVHAWIRGRIVNRLEAGSSTLFVVEALNSNAPDTENHEAHPGVARPLVYHNRTWHVLDDKSKI
jgi:flavin reductase (DIM6/NTAB) family NADH-FMN oxidoreductase RutF